VAKEIVKRTNKYLLDVDIRKELSKGYSLRKGENGIIFWLFPSTML